MQKYCFSRFEERGQGFIDFASRLESQQSNAILNLFSTKPFIDSAAKNPPFICSVLAFSKKTSNKMISIPIR